jgi:AraC-like DNA-binding protein
VGWLGEALGTTERQLLRRFNAAVGYGPKTLDRVLRFQRFLSRAPAVANGEEGLARIAAEVGYADQAHLSRECVRLSGLSPTRLVAGWLPLEALSGAATSSLADARAAFGGGRRNGPPTMVSRAEGNVPA